MKWTFKEQLATENGNTTTAERPHPLETVQKAMPHETVPAKRRSPGTKRHTNPDGTRTRQGRKCSGHLKSDGSPCPKWAMEGQKVCDTHGGLSRGQNQYTERNKTSAARKAEILNSPQLMSAVDSLAGMKALAEILTAQIDQAIEEGETIKPETLATGAIMLEACAKVIEKIERIRRDNAFTAIEYQAAQQRVIAVVCHYFPEIQHNAAQRHEISSMLDGRTPIPTIPYQPSIPTHPPALPAAPHTTHEPDHEPTND